MNFRRFRAGDKVSYVGYKFAQKLSGSLGIVDAQVNGTSSGLVVSFGNDSYVMDESHLVSFQGKVQEVREDQVEEEKPKDVEVTKRRGKRRSEDES